MRIHFEGHCGDMDDDGMVIMYGLVFDSILEVAKVFRNIKYNPEAEYVGMYSHGCKTIEDTVTGEVCVNGVWLPDETFISEFLRNGKRKNSTNEPSGANLK
jgi:hypothetical protein